MMLIPPITGRFVYKDEFTGLPFLKIMQPPADFAIYLEELKELKEAKVKKSGH